FFFQAEDGIRDFHVTGVQTCALPIFCVAMGIAALIAPQLKVLEQAYQFIQEYSSFITPGVFAIFLLGMFWKRTTGKAALVAALRSEERRVGKECRYGWWRRHVNKKLR